MAYGVGDATFQTRLHVITVFGGGGAVDDYLEVSLMSSCIFYLTSWEENRDQLGKTVGLTLRENSTD